MIEYAVIGGFLKMMYFLLEIMETSSEWGAKLNTCANRNINKYFCRELSTVQLYNRRRTYGYETYRSGQLVLVGNHA